MKKLVEKKITIEHDTRPEEAYDIALGLLKEFGAKFEDDGEGNIKYWVEEEIPDIKKENDEDDPNAPWNWRK